MEIKKNYKRTQLACYLGFVTQAMFAFLALAGDLGGAVGPAIIGTISQRAANNLQAGVLAGIGFPIVLVISVFYIRKKYR